MAPLLLLLASGCKDLRDKVSSKLYPEPAVDDGWKRDSTLVAKGPKILFRVQRKGGAEYIRPIAVFTKAAPRQLRLSKRGWSMLDIEMLWAGKEIIPVENGAAGSPVKMRQGMWENASAPLDTVAGCNTLVPLGRVSLPAGTQFAVANFKLPSSMKMLSSDVIEGAISQVPLLVAPTAGVTAAQLSHYTRNIQQIPRVGGEPGILLEYHDDQPPSKVDTSTIAVRRPRHLTIVLEKGMYGYKPSWVYSTTGGPADRGVLRFLAALDVDGDGRSELFFGADAGNGYNWTVAYQEWNGAWREMWKRTPLYCDN